MSDCAQIVNKCTDHPASIMNARTRPTAAEASASASVIAKTPSATPVFSLELHMNAFHCVTGYIMVTLNGAWARFCTAYLFTFLSGLDTWVLTWSCMLYVITMQYREKEHVQEQH